MPLHGEISPSQFTLKLAINDSLKQKILDARADGKSVKSVKVKIEATHSGRVNKNMFMYTPQGMRDGAQSWVKPYPKPVTVNHDPASAPLGRVVDAKYVDYGYNTVLDNLDYKKPGINKHTNKLLTDKVYRTPGYKGLGQIELLAEITDKDAIERILDGRYVTVSIGAQTDAAYCSICGTNKKVQSCSHSRGEVYDGQQCYYIGGLMTFDHISYVNSPADENAISSIVEDSDFGSTVCDIIDFEIEQIKDNTMTIKFADLSKKTKELIDHAIQLGFKTYTQPASDKLTAVDYLLVAESAFPIADAVSAVITKDFIEKNLEDSEDKVQALALIDAKIAELVPDFKSVEDFVSMNKDPEVTEPVVTNDAATAEFDNSKLIESISDAVIEKLKVVFTISDSFSSTRMRALEKEVIALAQDKAVLLQSYKDVIINQICAFEKDSSQEFVDKLSQRTLQSLEDKLSDISTIVKKGVDNVSDNVDNKVLDKASLSVEDTSTENVVEDPAAVVGSVADQNNQTTTDDVVAEPLTVDSVKKEYYTIVRSSGLSAASKYINGLRDSGLLPNNFTFN